MTEEITVATAIAAEHEAAVAEYLTAAGTIRIVRRCADVNDLLAVAEAARVAVAVVSGSFPGLDRSTVARLRECGVAVTGVVSPWDEIDLLHEWGVPSAAIEAGPQQLVDLVRTAGTTSSPLPPDGPQEPLVPVEDDTVPAETADDGVVVVVWGPPGAPGRTTIAVNLAAELAAAGVRTLLVDADTHAASIAQHLALLDEAPGVAAATRLADSGRLDVRSLAAVAPEAMPGLRVLTGLPRADRWPEIRDDALARVLQTARSLATVTVVDVAAPLEEDEDLSYDTRAPRRNAATLAALRDADEVIAVGAGDPVGLQRLVRGLADLAQAGKSEPTVVVSKVRRAAVGADPEAAITDALDRFASVTPAVLVPDDRAALDDALLAGRVLRECAPSSPAREAIAVLAGRFGAPPTRARRRGLLRGRRRGSMSA